MRHITEEEIKLQKAESKKFYDKALEESMCKKTLSTIKECKEWIEHLIKTGEYQHNNESLTNLLTELTRIPLTKNHPLNKYN